MEGREVCKIGVIYVHNGQVDQQEILANDLSSRSRRYAEFVESLGWIVDLASHRGYCGGLDRGYSAGRYFPFWANHNISIAYHDITLMPTKSKEEDRQQIHKKRHVGNDIVHIVWVEDSDEYDTSTITSQFNDVHIIVFPLSNGLFRVEVKTKTTLLGIAPLNDGMIVSKALLGSLVRETAISANRAVRTQKGGLKRPFPSRGQLIREIYNRHHLDRPFVDFLSNAIQGPKETEAEKE